MPAILGTQEAEAGDPKFQASLDYTERHCLKIKRVEDVVWCSLESIQLNYQSINQPTNQSKNSKPKENNVRLNLIYSPISNCQGIPLDKHTINSSRDHEQFTESDL